MNIYDKLAQELAGVRMTDQVGSLPPANDPLLDDGQTDYVSAMESFIPPPAEPSPIVDPFVDAAAPVAEPAPEIPAPAPAGGSESVSLSVPFAVPKYSNKAGLGTILDKNLQAGTQDLAALESEAAGIAGEKIQVAQDLAEADKSLAGGQVEAVDQHMADQDEAYVKSENAINSLDEEIKQLSSREPDPGRFWDTRTDGQKALYFITMALQAFSNPSEVPAVSQTLMRFIDQDIAAQEKRMASEVDAAQGRAKSVREIIMLGKEKDDAIYQARQSRLKALYDMNTAQIKATSTGIQAKEELSKTRSVLAAAMADNREKYFKGKLEIESQAIARGHLAIARSEEKRKAAAASSQGAPQGVFVQNLTAGGIGEGGKSVVPNPTITGAGAKLYDLASEHASSSQVLGDGLQILREARERGEKSPFTSPEFRQWARRSGPALSNMQGVKGAQSDRDVMDAGAGLGRNLIDKNGILSLETLANSATDWQSVEKVLEAMDRSSSRYYETGIKALSDERQSPALKLQTATELAEERRAEGRKSREASAEGQVRSMAGLGNERTVAEETKKVLPFLSGKTPAELTTESGFEKGRAEDVRGKLRDDAYRARDLVDKAKKAAKSPADKMAADVERKRIDAAIWTMENTPDGVSEKAYLQKLKEAAERDASRQRALGAESPRRRGDAIEAYEVYKENYYIATGRKPAN